MPDLEPVLVAVVTYHSAELVDDLVAALRTGLADVEWQLVVADNASTDDTVARVMAAEPTAMVVRSPRNAGYAAGVNAAVAAGPPRGSVLVLNPDVRLAPGSGRALLAALAEPGVGVVVPRLVDGDGALILSQRREPTVLRAWADAVLGAERAGQHRLLGEMVSDPRRYEAACDVDWAEGSTQLISAECWARTGEWDESFFLYSEETDFDLRARDAGFRVRYEPAAQATHLEGGYANPGLYRLLVLNRVRLFRRRHGPLASALFWLAVLVREASRAALGHPIGKAAFRGLLSLRRWRETPGPDAVTP